MRFQEIALSTLFFGATVLATNNHLQQRHAHVHPGDIFKRQSEFVPNTTTAEGSTCADAFGAGYETCREASGGQNRLCYNPSIGQTCCQSSWACPVESYCLSSGSCCPNGTDAAACAQAASSTASSVLSSTTSTSGGSSGGSGGSSAGKTTGTSSGTKATATPNYAADSWRSKGANIGFAGLVLGAVIML